MLELGGRDVELFAELFICGGQGINKVEILHAEITEHFTSGPDVLGEVVVQQQGESFLFLQLPIHVSGQVLYFGLHAGERFEEHIWVSSDKIAHVDFSQVRVVLLNELNLLLDHVLSILEGQLGVVINHAN